MQRTRWQKRQQMTHERPLNANIPAPSAVINVSSAWYVQGTVDTVNQNEGKKTELCAVKMSLNASVPVEAVRYAES